MPLTIPGTERPEITLSSTPAALEIATFALGATASLGASGILASRIERVGGRLRVSEALLGMLAALAADSPEITSSVGALRSGQHAVGIGVVLGSNVFNLAALIGVGSLVAGSIALHRRVVLLEGAVGLVIAAVSLLVATALIGAAAGLAIGGAVFLAYLVLIGSKPAAIARFPLPAAATAWLSKAVHEEGMELSPFAPAPARGAWADGALIAAALATVIVASTLMERAGVQVGSHYHLRPVVTGGVVLAAVTSLPNAVAAVYLARRGRGPAVLSEAMNSNALNVLVGLLVAGTVIGLGHISRPSLAVAWWYAGLTLATLVVAYLLRGVNRLAGVAIVAAYAVFVVVLVA